MVAPDSRAKFIVEDGKAKLVIDRNNEPTKSKEENGITLLKEIGNSIHESIQLEADYPELHTDKKLPLLDIKMWIEEQRNEDDRPVNIVMYEFYTKQVSSKAVIHEKSAMPKS